MKKILGTITLVLALASCANKPPSEYDVLNDELGAFGAQMVRVRGCEYLKSHVYLGSVYTHCGDCDNPIHKK